MPRTSWFWVGMLVLAQPACGDERGTLAQESFDSTASPGVHWAFDPSPHVPDDGVVTLLGIDAGTASPAEKKPDASVVNEANEAPPTEPPATPDSANPQEAPDAAVPQTDPELEPPSDQEGDHGDDEGLLGSVVCGLLGSVLCADPLECIDGVCTERHACAPDKTCDARCTTAACNVDCTDAATCKPDCGPSASCDVSCAGAKSCEPRCRGGSCEIDCRGAEKCERVKCEEGAQCLLHCTPGAVCRFEGCKNPTQCANDVLVCNRECPLL